MCVKGRGMHGVTGRARGGVVHLLIIVLVMATLAGAPVAASGHSGTPLPPERHYTVELASVGTSGQQPEPPPPAAQPALSVSGSHVAFVAETDTYGSAFYEYTPHTAQVYLRDLESRTTDVLTVGVGGVQNPALGDGDSAQPTVNGDGSVVAFVSEATDLVDGGTDSWDLYVWDAEEGLSPVDAEFVSDGTAAGRPSIDAAGELVAFVHGEPTVEGLPPFDMRRPAERGAVLLHDVETGALLRVSPPDGISQRPVLSADGTTLVYYHHADEGWELRLREVGAGTEEVREGPTGGAAAFLDAPSLSADGTLVLFHQARDVENEYGPYREDQLVLLDRISGVQEEVHPLIDSAPTWAAVRDPRLAADGGHVVFTSAIQLPSGDVAEQVWRHDLTAGATELVSHSEDGDPAERAAVAPAVSADGDTIAFASSATNLGRTSTNLDTDIFVARRGEGGGPTEPGAISSVSFTVPRVSRPRAAILGSDLTITLRGTPGQAASARIGYLAWPSPESEEPRASQQTIPLREETPGDYRGAWPVAEGTVQITSVTGVLNESAGDMVEAPSTGIGLPLDVTGAIRLMLDEATDLTPLLGQEVLAYSAGLRAGIRHTAAGDDPLLIPGAAAGTYEVTALDVTGDHLLIERDVAVTAGRTVEHPAELRRPASLAVRATAADERPLRGALVRLTDGDGEPLSSGRTDADGWYSSTARLVAGDVIVAFVQAAADEELATFEGSLESLTVGPNEREIVVPTPVRATVQGTVMHELDDEALVPLPGARVVVSQDLFGRTWSANAVTDELGNYAVDALVGPAIVSAGGAGAPPVSRAIEVPSGGTTQDFELLKTRSYAARVTLTGQYPGELEFRLPVDSATARQFLLRTETPHGSEKVRHVEDGGAFVVQARPGDDVTVCASGIAFMLPADCVTQRAGAGSLDYDLRLVSMNDGMAGVLLDAEGEPYEGVVSVDVYRVVDGERGPAVAQASTNGPRFAAHFEGEGEFEFEVQLFGPYGGSVGPARFTKSSGSIAYVGEHRARTNRWAARGGNFVIATRPEVLPTDELEIRTQFTNVEQLTVTEAELLLQVPAGTALVPRSVTVDGQPVPDPAVVGDHAVVSVGDDGRVPPGRGGVVRYRLAFDGLTESTLAVTSRLRGRVNGPFEEVIGTGLTRVVGVTLDAPRHTGLEELTVTGRGPVQERVTVLAGNRPLGEAVVGLDGVFRLRVRLPDAGAGHTHVLRARTTELQPALQSEAQLVTYDDGLAELVGVTVWQRPFRRRTFDPREGIARFPFIFEPGEGPVHVELEFSDPTAVESATVRVGGISTAARFEGDRWIGTVEAVGDVDVEFVRRELTPDRFPQLTEAQTRNRLPEFMSDFVIDEEAERRELENGVEISVAAELPSLGGDMEVTMTFVDDGTVPTAEQIAEADEVGVPVYGVTTQVEQRDDGSLVLLLEGYVPVDRLRSSDDEDMAGMGLAAMLAVDLTPEPATVHATSASVVGKVVKGTWEVAFRGGTGGKSLTDAILGMLEDNMQTRAAALYDLLSCPEKHQAHKAAVDKLVHDALLYDIETAGITLAGYGAGAALGLATAGLGAVGTWGATELANLYRYNAFRLRISQLRHAIGQTKCEDPPKPEKPVPPVPGAGPITYIDLPHPHEYPPPRVVPAKVAAPRVIYDPSGIVYEAVESNLLAGVTATVWEAPAVEGIDTPPESGWERWDAEWFEQENPQVTGDDGYYGWDVPENWWRVTYEKEGYELGQSEALRVLPPHFDVNEGLVSVVPPSVTSVLAYPDGVEVTFDKHMSVAAFDPLAITVREDALELVAGEAEAIEPEEAPGGELLARTFRFAPTAPLVVGQELGVHVDAFVRSYADRSMAGDHVQHVVVAVRSAEPEEPGGGGGDPGDPGGGTPGGGTPGGGTPGGGTPGPEAPGTPSTPTEPAEPTAPPLEPGDDGFRSSAPIPAPQGDARTATVTIATPVGPVTISFEGLGGPGTLDVTWRRGAPALPGVNLLEDWFDITTDVQFSSARVCVPMDADQAAALHSVGTPLSLFHQPAGQQLRDITDGSVSGGTMCGTTDAFSPFYVGVTRTTRLSGPDRFATAAAVSAATFPGGAVRAYLATGEGFADALAGGPLAGADAPILLTGRDVLPAATAAELRRLRVEEVFILGGPAAVSVEVEAAVRTMTFGVRRLAGADRFATAAAISRSAFEQGSSTVYLATGSAFADALSGGAAAAADAAPLLLVGPDHLPDATAAELERLRPEQIIVLGGSAAVAEQVLERLRERTGARVERVAGSDRFATAAAVAGRFPIGSATQLATGLQFPDALAGVPAAAAAGGPVLLTLPEQLPAATEAALARLAPGELQVLGGQAAVSRATEMVAATHVQASVGAVASSATTADRSSEPSDLLGAVNAALRSLWDRVTRGGRSP
jgi:putative cell wall-binding protein/Tol biopolymer transport system component